MRVPALEGPVPEWAIRYDAPEYPRHGVTGDAVPLALGCDDGRVVLQALVVVRAREPFRGLPAWPGGFLSWSDDEDTLRTAERELREEAGVPVGEYVEALGSYSRNGRDPRQFAGHRDERTGEWIARGSRVTTNAYLMLMRTPHDPPTPGGDAAAAHWADVYEFLPWEDLREPPGRSSVGEVVRALSGVAGATGRRERVEAAFGSGGQGWNEERVAERFSLLRSAGLVPEGRRDLWGRTTPRAGEPQFGGEMAFDHREMLADALGRLRGKIKYLPAALMALTGERTTLDELQAACEAIAGRPLHRANFRRAIATQRTQRPTRSPRIVVGTGERRERRVGERGVAPEIFRFRPDAVRTRLESSIRFPWLPIAATDE